MVQRPRNHEVSEVCEKKAEDLKKKGLLDYSFAFLDWVFDLPVKFFNYLLEGEFTKGSYELEEKVSKEIEESKPEHNGLVINFNKEVQFKETKPIVIPSKVASKLFAYARAVNAEVGGLLVIEANNGIVTVTDALLYNQRVSSGGVELDSDNLAKQLYEISLTEPEKLEKLKGWWHSHSSFATFWSPVDDDCFASILRVCPVVYGIVVNKAGCLKARVDMKTEIGTVNIGNADYNLGKVVPMPECAVEVRQKVRGFSFFDIWPLKLLKNVGKRKYLGREKHIARQHERLIRGVNRGF